MMDTTAHNLSNVSTVGFRGRTNEFSEALSVRMHEVHPRWENAPGGIPASVHRGAVVYDRGHGVVSGSSVIDDNQGPLTATGRPLDLAVDGAGYFILGDADGNDVLYTRDGVFHIDDERYLVHSSGFYLLDDESERIRLPEGTHRESISVTGDGSLGVDAGGGEDTTVLGKLQVGVFSDGRDITALGENLYTAVPGRRSPRHVHPGGDGVGGVRQGFLEASNADLAGQMLNLLLAQRSFQLNSRAARTADEMLEMANQIPR